MSKLCNLLTQENCFFIIVLSIVIIIVAVVVGTIISASRSQLQSQLIIISKQRTAAEAAWFFQNYRLSHFNTESQNRMC